MMNKDKKSYGAKKSLQNVKNLESVVENFERGAMLREDIINDFEQAESKRSHNIKKKKDNAEKFRRSDKKETHGIGKKENSESTKRENVKKGRYDVPGRKQDDERKTRSDEKNRQNKEIKRVNAENGQQDVNGKTSLCPYFKKCGGCKYLDMDYEAQLKLKQGIVAKHLKDIVSSQGVKIEKIVGADEHFNYRNKVHSVFSRNGMGKVVRGIYREETHKLVNVSGCLIEDKLADAIIEEVKRLLPSFKYKVYDEDNGSGWLRHVLVRVGRKAAADSKNAGTSAEGENHPDNVNIMLVLVTATVPFTGKNNFIKAIRAKFPQITTIIQNINDKKTSMVLGERNIVCYGPGYIEDSLLGLNFRISPSAFYQVNHAQAQKLYSLAKEMASLNGNDTVIDAYCGTGTIGMSMADSTKEVVGVELNGEAVKDAGFNAKRNGISNIRFINADATEWMTSYAQYAKDNGTSGKEDAAGVLIMDPPRAGSTPEFINAAVSMKFSRIVYVSCNPETLARDLKGFIKNGYTVKRVVPVDMFPWTEHVETVCLLSKLREAKHHVSVTLDMDEMDLTSAESKATYEEIKKYVAEHNDGMKVSSLNIAQVKRKCGIELAENYNLPKSEDSRQPQCPKEKEEAIIEALKEFQMI